MKNKAFLTFLVCTFLLFNLPMVLFMTRLIFPTMELEIFSEQVFSSGLALLSINMFAIATIFLKTKK